MTEDQFQRSVIDLAHLLGWRVAHFRPAKTRHGWRTPVQADGAGFPDMVLCHPRHGVLYRELKSHTGQLSAYQVEWLEALRSAGADAGVWRPSNFARLADELQGKPTSALEITA